MAEKIKVITRRKKFIGVDVPLIRSKMELIGNVPEDLEGKTIKLDLTRQLKGKSVEAIVKVRIENEKAVAHPVRFTLMSYFIRRMIRKRISYVEDSFLLPSQQSMLRVKPFLITRKKVSKAVRRTLRNKAKNWIEDYFKERTDDEIFNEIITNRIQKPLSLYLKKTYPLSLCEIRSLEIIRTLNPEEVPKIEKKERKVEKIEEDEIIDQFAEIEEERKKKAEKEIKDTQEKASKLESSEEEEIKSEKKTRKKSTKKKAEKEE